MSPSPSKWESRMAIASHVANLLMAITVIVSAFIAVRELSAIHEQIQATRQQSGMDMLWRLHDRMASEAMRGDLSSLGAIQKPTTAQVFSEPSAQGHVLRNMANFYEMLALSVNRGYMEYGDVRGYIGTDVMEFWEGVDGAVLTLRRQEGRPSMYCELEKLSTRLSKDLGYPQPSPVAPAVPPARP